MRLLSYEKYPQYPQTRPWNWFIDGRINTKYSTKQGIFLPSEVNLDKARRKQDKQEHNDKLMRVSRFSTRGSVKSLIPNFNIYEPCISLYSRSHCGFGSMRPRYSPPLPTWGAYPCQWLKKTSFSYQLSSCLQFIKIELGSTGGVPKTTYSDSFDIEALGS